MREGFRLKGGAGYITFNDALGWYPIIHLWDNLECNGEPEEFVYPKKFATESECLKYYKKVVRPLFDRIAKDKSLKVNALKKNFKLMQ